MKYRLISRTGVGNRIPENSSGKIDNSCPVAKGSIGFINGYGCFFFVSITIMKSVLQKEIEI